MEAHRRKGEYLIIQYAPTDRPRVNVGVLLFEPACKRLDFRIIRDWSSIATPGDIESLAVAAVQFERCAREIGAAQFLEVLENTLVDVLRVSDRSPIEISDTADVLNRLFHEHVQR